MNQFEFLAITCILLKAREKSGAQGVIGSGFASQWLKNWHESFKPITKRRIAIAKLLSRTVIQL